MKYTRLFFISILLFPIAVNAQDYSTVFGKVGQAELDLSSNIKNNNAEAVVLFDIGKSYFVREDDSFILVFERKTRVKILTQAGLKYAEVEVPFYQEGNINEQVDNIEAYTYNFDQERLVQAQLSAKNFHDEKLNEQWNLRKFVVPEVKVGSIIEYKYTVRSQYLFNLRDWEFQWRIPVIYSEYETKMIPFYEYTYLLQGATKFDSQNSYVDNGFPERFGPIEYRQMTHSFVMKNLPAFNDEEYITSINDYIVKIDFQLSKIYYTDGTRRDIIKTWKDMIEEMDNHDDFGKFVKKSEKAARKLFDLKNLETKPQGERYNAILSYVKENYKWNSRNSKYASKNPSDFVKDKFGNSADINLFAVGLLKAAGIDAYPLLVSTRGNGKIKVDYPFAHFFNYVLIASMVDGKYLVTDATNILIPNDRVPFRCLNDKGLLINNDKVVWIPLECNIPSELITTISMNFAATNLNANVDISASEYFGAQYRDKYGEDKKVISDKLSEQGYNVVDSSIIVENQNNCQVPYVLKYNVEGQSDIVNEKIYLLPFLKECMTDNPLKQNIRTYPIDITFPKKGIYNSTIVVPDGYIVDFLPENQLYTGDLFDLDYHTSCSGNTINVMFKYNFKKAVYPATDFRRIKYFISEIIKKGNEKIVLSKKM